MLSSLDRLPDDPAALKAIILAQQEEVARLTARHAPTRPWSKLSQIRIARLQRPEFGPSSEKIEREIEQLQLTLEDLEVAMAAAGTPIGRDDTGVEPEAALSPLRNAGAASPGVADRAPRERLIVLDPGDRCPECGGTLRLIAMRTYPRSSTSSPPS